MSSVAVVELVAWVLSAAHRGLAAGQDMVRVSRTHDEATLVNAPDPLEVPFARRQPALAPRCGPS